LVGQCDPRLEDWDKRNEKKKKTIGAQSLPIQRLVSNYQEERVHEASMPLWKLPFGHWITSYALLEHDKCFSPVSTCIDYTNLFTIIPFYFNFNFGLLIFNYFKLVNFYFILQNQASISTKKFSDIKKFSYQHS
jgi:hypothetical protein